MGHRFSKPNRANIVTDKCSNDDNNTAATIIGIQNTELIDINQLLQQNILANHQNKNLQLANNTTRTLLASYPMNSSSSTNLASNTSLSSSSSSSTTTTALGKQFVIKIQLTKMETDTPTTTSLPTNPTNTKSSSKLFEQHLNSSSATNGYVGGSSKNITSINSNGLALNHSSSRKTSSSSPVSLSNNEYEINKNDNKNNNNCKYTAATTSTTINRNSLNKNSELSSTSQQSISNNKSLPDGNFTGNSSDIMSDLTTQLNKCNLNNINDEVVTPNIPLPNYQVMNMVSTSKSQAASGNATSIDKNVCDKKQNCSRRKKLLSSSASRKCCKCPCRDTKKNVDESSSKITNHSSSSSNDKPKSTSKNSSERSWTSRLTSGLKNKSDSKSNSSQKYQTQANDNQKKQLPVHSTTVSSINIPTSNNSAAVMVVRPSTANAVPIFSEQFRNSPGTNQVAIWADNQMLVVQIPQASQLVLERLDDGRANCIQTAGKTSRSDAETQSEFNNNCTRNVSPNQWSSLISGLKFTSSAGPKVHSQEDFIHCLVPDLEKITASSFYWGKMDRYEAERLLDKKPEGTFLLRDSAQEEYLFSVTFRKYDRSLHARIEQLNHKFSFDCHDPGVFTASTVTGLLEHYKDPTCVMFFEPMLTIPLNRSNPFSLQQLSRATIVSNISYDGINELQLPNCLKSYLKEYHYKLRVRVKPFDETFYACS